MSCPDGAVAEWLNHDCFCVDIDATRIWRAVDEAAHGVISSKLLAAGRPHLFSSAPVFISQTQLAAMEAVAGAVESVAASRAFQATVLEGASQIAVVDKGPRGAFMGYDFHLTADGPKLIEVNTNAGGAFLNAVLAQAQLACCPEVAAVVAADPLAAFEEAVWAMFEAEWALAGRAGRPGVVAIVDDAPTDQYLYPEFLLAQAFFERRGVETIIVDPAVLTFADGRLTAGGVDIDLVYNRLVDFGFATPAAAALRAAYLADAVVVTPNPHNHALLADKRNLALLSDTERLAELGISTALRTVLAAAVLRTRPVTESSADALWAERRSLFFKPAAGHAGKAVYRGDKLTRGVWATILQGGYVAQDFAAPSERRVQIEGAPQARKMDVRLYTYAGKTLLAAARLYSGQTTNFRTPGGGFAPVIVLAPEARQALAKSEC